MLLLSIALVGCSLGSSAPWTEFDANEDAANQQNGNSRQDEFEQMWADLASDDAALAYRATWALAEAPGQAAPFLEKRIEPISPADPKRIALLIRQLNDDEFAVREKASAELRTLGDLAEPDLRKALAEGASAEAQRRLETLIKHCEQQIVSVDLLRSIRAVEALEQIRTPEARRALAKLAQGAPRARLTREANASLARLGKQPTAKPEK